ncbi:hypothetical protein NEMBOFW57_002392 [Staphylotrichum longicolle]|uniref:Uncharacterized protein n=1 Tax=Staphylotrichum longicolle TaxID=669026 RepID=A0AAD4F631_9PEZI|nr:hypothetical protein NEMBOFW57_002392 [Staphylotrichum longicolle]
MRSLQSIADDPTRTHRSWYPKYGRVQKCDYCNKRSEGTLHVCSDCHVRICEHCARARKWDRDTSRHFIDVDACDWVVRKAVNLSNQGTSNAPKKTRGRKAKRRAPSSPGDGASSTASQRRKIQKRESTEDKDDTRPMAALRPAPLRPRRGQDLHSVPQSSTSSHNHNENLGPNHQASAPGNIAPPARMETSTPRPGWINVNLPPPRTRPVSRQTAARALLGMSEFSRYNDNDNEGEDDDDDNHEDRLGHHGNLMAEDRGAEGFARARTAHPLGGPRVGSAFAAPAPPSNWERDVLIQDIYEWVYGVRPNPNPSRFRSRIPDTWGGDWPFPTPVHGQSRHGESQSRGWTQPPHQGQSSYPHSMRSDYPPAPRSTTPPAHTPNQPASPTLNELLEAWHHSPTVGRLVAANRALFALGLLWDVLGLRRERASVSLRDESQAVHWFVAERDRLVRMETDAVVVAPAPAPAPAQQHGQGLHAPIVQGQQGWEEEDGEEGYGYERRGREHGHGHGRENGYGYGYALSMAGEDEGHGQGMVGAAYGYGHHGFGAGHGEEDNHAESASVAGGGRAEGYGRTASAEAGDDWAASRATNAVVLAGGEEDTEEE